ncbi:MAG: ATP synthase F1 subunit delta [Planctomyces sp.]|nr:ATP synthase F1 subunit delta [Planctomyces sp.]
MAQQRLKTRPDSVLEDPGALAVASLYARSYLTAAETNGLADAVEELNSFADDLLGKYPELSNVLFSDSISRNDKLGVIERIVAPVASPYFTNFLRVLVQHGRIDMICLIRQVMTRLREEAAGQRRVRIRTARALTETSRNALQTQLKEKLGFEPLLQETVDESLIGGLVIQVGDTVYDSSLRSRLKQLSGRLVERTLNEIQSGRDRFSHT